MKKFTKGCLLTALILFILGCAICVVCGILGGFRQIESGLLNGVMGIPFGFYRQVDGGFHFGFFDSEWEREDAFWEKENWKKTNVDGTKQKLNVTTDTLRSLEVVVTDCNFIIEESEDENVWLSVKGDTSKTYYKIEKDTVGKDILSIENAGYHRVGNWRNGPNDTISLYLPGGCDLDYVSIEMGAGYMEAIPLKGDILEINVGAGVCEAQGFEAETINLLVGAGQIETDGLKADTAVLEVGLGEIVVQGLDVKELMEVELGMGNAEISGKATGLIDADCSMGNLTMHLAGSEDDYGFEVDCDMGDVRVGSHHYSGLGSSRSWNSDRKDRMEIDCEMGNITITFVE